MKNSRGYFKRIVSELTNRERLLHQKALNYIKENPNVSYKEARSIVSKDILK